MKCDSWPEEQEARNSFLPSLEMGWGAQSWAAAPLHVKVSAEVVQASDWNVSFLPPSASFLEASDWEETQGQTQNLLEGLDIRFALQTPQDPAGEQERDDCVSLKGLLHLWPIKWLSGHDGKIDGIVQIN